jgi:hypothetical protein
MTKSPYRKYYEEKKKYYQENRKDWTKLHIHNAALRYAVKRFLADLWVEWGELENLPTTPPYSHRFESLNKTITEKVAKNN